MPRRRRRRELKHTGPPTREEMEALEERLRYVEQKANMGRGISAVLSGEADVDDSYQYDWEGNAATATEAVNAVTVGGFVPDEIPYITDGIAPALSPAPTVRGALGALVVEWDAIANADIVTYEIHLSETTGFIPDATTLAAEKRGSGPLYLRTLPDGTALEYWADPPTNSVPKVYYVQVVAKDADGSAAASSEGSGSMDQTATDDLVANAVTAEKLAATIVLATLFQTATSGQRVEFDVDGIRLYDTDGTTILVNLPTDGTDPYFAAEIDARGIDIDATNAAWRSINWLTSIGFPCFSLTASDPSGVGDDAVCSIDAQANATDGNASLQLTAFNGGDDQASITLDSSPPAGVGFDGYSAILAYATSAGGPKTRTILGSTGDSEFVQVDGGTTEFRFEQVAIAVNINSGAAIGAHSGGSQAKTVSGVNATDKVFIIGDTNGTNYMHVRLDVTGVDEITVRWFNADSVSRTPGVMNFDIIVIHRS